MLGRLTRGVSALSGLLWLASTGAVLGCRKTADVFGAGGAAPLAASSKAEAAPSVGLAARPAGITWVDPPGLRRVPPMNPTHKASYVVPRAPGDSEDGQMAVFHLAPGDAGTPDADIEHWVSQFSAANPSDVKRAEHDADGLHEQTVEIEHGTFDAGQTPAGSPGPKRDYALEGALVQGPNGAYSFKMTGPARTVAAARSAFMQLLGSVHVVHPDH